MLDHLPGTLVPLLKNERKRKKASLLGARTRGFHTLIPMSLTFLVCSPQKIGLRIQDFSIYCKGRCGNQVDSTVPNPHWMFLLSVQFFLCLHTTYVMKERCFQVKAAKLDVTCAPCMQIAFTVLAALTALFVGYQDSLSDKQIFRTFLGVPMLSWLILAALLFPVISLGDWVVDMTVRIVELVATAAQLDNVHYALMGMSTALKCAFLCFISAFGGDLVLVSKTGDA